MKFIVLTEKANGKKLDVQADQVGLMQDVDGGGTHIVVAGAERTVAETKAQIYALMGIVAPQ